MHCSTVPISNHSADANKPSITGRTVNIKSTECIQSHANIISGFGWYFGAIKIRNKQISYQLNTEWNSTNELKANEKKTEQRKQQPWQTFNKPTYFHLLILCGVSIQNNKLPFHSFILSDQWTMGERKMRAFFKRQVATAWSGVVMDGKVSQNQVVNDTCEMCENNGRWFIKIRTRIVGQHIAYISVNRNELTHQQ